MTASWNRIEQVDHSLASNLTVVCCAVNKNLELFSYSASETAGVSVHYLCPQRAYRAIQCTTSVSQTYILKTKIIQYSMVQETRLNRHDFKRISPGPYLFTEEYQGGRFH